MVRIRKKSVSGVLRQVCFNVRLRDGSKSASLELSDRIPYRPCGTDVDINIPRLERGKRLGANGTGDYPIDAHVRDHLGGLDLCILRAATVP